MSIHECLPVIACALALTSCGGGHENRPVRELRKLGGLAGMAVHGHTLVWRAVAQAAQYERLVDGCRPCARFTVWGLDDDDSWVPGAYPGFGHATLLDGDLRPKPAFDAFRTALLRR
jgi:GH35 family endo-1,4-beta-xylanase